MNHFKELSLPASLEKALAAMQFHTPTPIQQQAIPVALTGQDILGCAQTGTGKTAAFCIPILAQMLSDPKKSHALILAPTRELALQIDTFWKKITQFTPGFHSTVIIGGMPMKAQVKALARPHRVLIATPGRLVDHLNRQKNLLSKASFLVIDEADRMLDMGFAPQLSQILRNLPPARQTLFFTATWSPELDPFAKKYLNQPVRITVGTVSRAAPQITQSVVMTTVGKKNDALLDELNRCTGSVLVFTRTKSRTDRVARYLSEYGVAVNLIHGGRSQGQRNSALAAFRTGKARVLIATDIAARGIDVQKIGHVINYDLPQSSEDYIHRIGRTGRAGEKGQAISLVTPEERYLWKQISRLLAKTGSEVPSLGQDSAEINEGSDSPLPPKKKSKFKKPFPGRRKGPRRWGEQKGENPFNPRRPRETVNV